MPTNPAIMPDSRLFIPSGWFVLGPLLLAVALTAIVGCGGGGGGGGSSNGSLLAAAEAPTITNRKYRLDPSLVIEPNALPVSVMTLLGTAPIGTQVGIAVSQFDPGIDVVEVALLTAANGTPIAPFVELPTDGTTSGEVLIDASRIALGLVACHPWLMGIDRATSHDFFNLATSHPDFPSMRAGVIQALAQRPEELIDPYTNSAVYSPIQRIVEDTLAAVVPQPDSPDACVPTSQCGPVQTTTAFDVQAGAPGSGSAIFVNTNMVFFGYETHAPGNQVTVGLVKPKTGWIDILCPSPFTVPATQCLGLLDGVPITIDVQAFGASIDLGYAGGRGTVANTFYMLISLLNTWIPVVKAPADQLAEDFIDYRLNGGGFAAFDNSFDAFAQSILTMKTAYNGITKTGAWLAAASDPGNPLSPTNFENLYTLLYGTAAPGTQVAFVKDMSRFAGAVSKAIALVPIFYDAVATAIEGPREYCVRNQGGNVTLECLPPYAVVAAFDWSPLVGTVGDAITFNPAATTTTGSFPSAPTYEWIFDDFDDSWDVDQTTGAAKLPVQHVFADPGLHAAILQVRVGNYVFLSSQTVTVNALSTARVCVNPSQQVAAVYTIGQALPAPQHLQVSNCGSTGTVLDWSVTESPNATWLDQSPLFGSVPQGAGSDDVAITFIPGGLPVGIYNATLRFVNAADPNDLVPVPVKLTVQSGPANGTIELVSKSSAGVLGNLDSVRGGSSGDGRYIAFESRATNLVAGDTNNVEDIFLHDSTTSVTRRVSVDSAGSQSNSYSFLPSISANGRFVAYQSAASNLVPGDTNGVQDIFIYELASGMTTRASIGSTGVQANGTGSFDAFISADGRFVAFSSSASNLVTGDSNGTSDAFIRDRINGQTIRVSVSSSGTQGNGGSGNPSVSSDGRFVAFRSGASNLVAGDTNGRNDIFVRDVVAGATSLASVSSLGIQANDNSAYPIVSADGRFVAYESTASNLVANDANGARDVFLYGRLTGQTVRASVSTAGIEGNAASGSGNYISPKISGDGRYVAFESNASNLVPGDSNGAKDVFVRDLNFGTTSRSSVAADGAQANGSSFLAGGADSGLFVVFWSFATNLVPGDNNGQYDVFVRSL